MFIISSNSIRRLIALTVFILAFVSAIRTNEPSQHSSDGPNLVQNSSRLCPYPKYNESFLLLMSRDEISLVLLPLIDNGCIRVAYQLADSPDLNLNSSQESEQNENDEDGEDDDDGTRKVVIADAREYEQQMRQSATILGKFARQQKTATVEGKSISGREEVATSNSVDGQEVKQPRRRRSNNLTENHGNRRRRRSRRSNSSSNGTVDGNNNSSSVNAVPESSSPNVTSARTNAESREDQKEIAPEGGDRHRKNGGPSFSDFDVHMAFGYAFVSDSAGRIHKFRLSGFDGRENSKENDYTNTIDAATVTELKGNFSRYGKTTDRNFALPNGVVDDVTASSNLESGTRQGDSNAISDAADDVDDDANKVSSGSSSSSNSANRISGRHPPASGLGRTVARGGGSVENVMLENSSGNETPNSDNLKSGNNHGRSQEPVRKHFDSSKARIIWSRTRRDFSYSHHSGQKLHEDSSSSSLSNGVKTGEGAFPQLSNNEQRDELVAGIAGSSNLKDDNQMANGAEQHMGGAFGESEQTSVGDLEAIKLEQQRKANSLRTEIAVDWLNNLLFVLDKYRLFVMDFDGNDELLLIDDFNINNRPVELKVDPINCFLFWLQVGTFHNTIYKLDLGLLSRDRHGSTLKLTGQSSHFVGTGLDEQNERTNESSALLSHHYAHPIVANLPSHTRHFIIDYKHSRIYVPLTSSSNGSSVDTSVELNKPQCDEAETFSQDSIESMTHMNSTALKQSSMHTDTQILAFNLDGTDVGPLRTEAEKGHLSGLDDMQDITLDSDKGHFYWLTDHGKNIIWEHKNGSIYDVLDGKSYLQLKYFDSTSNQPRGLRQRLVLALPTTTNRQVRSDKDRIEDNRIASSLDGRYQSGIETDVTRFSRNAPYIILGITCLVVLSVYSIYAFVFQVLGSSSAVSTDSREGSIVESSIGEMRTDCGPTPTSTSYNASNAIDEHYGINNQALFNLDTGRLADLGGWPTNMLDMSNKLYVPVEVLQDEALSLIQRIPIDQLKIERKNALGEGHFGEVLQGVITCKINEKGTLIFKNRPADRNGFNATFYASSSATSCTEQTNGDYLTPKSHTSTASDYLMDNMNSSQNGSWNSFNNDVDKNLTVTEVKVAVKKLKCNASVEEKRDFLQEAKLLANFNHPNIVSLIGICLDGGTTQIVMELMLGGDLIRYMQESRREDLTLSDLLSICLDIVNGCCYLEQLTYIHRDLAARNCLVSSRRREERVVKLADFGLARDIYKDSYYKKINDSAMPLKWMAPECLMEQKFTIKSDVWSFGVVMWEVMNYCQEKPYEGIEPCFMSEQLIQGNRLRKPEICSEDIYGLMKWCWQLQPEERPTFQECRAHLIEIKNSLDSFYI